MRLELEYGSATIVLLGSFNPRIFHPNWLEQHNLISASEAEDSEINLIHADITSFRVGTRNIQVEPNRFSVDATEAPFIALADFVAELFNETLPHTPIYRLGINRSGHFRVRDEETRNEIGRKLAPLTPWGDWGKDIASSAAKARGGFVSLTMQHTRFEGEIRGHIQATVQPSAMPSLSRSGVFVTINDDYYIEDNSETDHSRKILEILTERFDKSLNLSHQIIDQIMSLDMEAAR